MTSATPATIHGRKLHRTGVEMTFFVLGLDSRDFPFDGLLNHRLRGRAGLFSLLGVSGFRQAEGYTLKELPL